MSGQPVNKIDGQAPPDCSTLSGSDQLLCLIANPFASSVKQTAVFSALGYSVGLMIGITLIFSIVRPHNSVVYAPKLKYADEKHAPPRIGKGMFSWFMPVATIGEKELVDKVGIDGTVFLRFTKMCRDIFAFTTIIAVVLLPANVISSSKDPTAYKNFWVTSTPQYATGAALWIHVACAWAINMVVAFFLGRNYVAVTRLRRRYFESAEYLKSLHSRTLMFTDIPAGSRSDEGILRLADEVEHTAGLPRAAIARNVKELPDLIEEHREMIKALEMVLAKYLKNPDKLPLNRPTMTPSRKYRKNNGSGKVDAIDYLTERISELEAEIKHVRESIDKRNAMPFGFASYERIEDAHTVAYAAKSKHPQGTTIRLAPRPNDLIWKNLPLTKSQRNWKRMVNNFWIVILTLVWIAPNAMIAIFLTNLLNLANVWHGFKNNFNNHHTFWSIVQGIASPALSSLVYLVLPIIFRRLSIHAGDRTKTSRERHVATKLYAFFVFNNLIVFSAFSAIFTFVSQVISNRQNKGDGVWEAIVNGNFVWNMMTGLCEVTPYWLTWLLQRQLGAAADLAQLLNLTWGWYMRTFHSPTPRQTIEWTAPPPFDYAVYYNYFLFYSTVALCFVTLQPLVIPVTAFYFAVDYWLKKYLLLYVLVTKTESGGQYWRILFNRFIFGIILADCTMALIIKANGTYVMVGLIAPLPILMLAFKWYCARVYDDQNEFYTKATLRDPEHLADAGHKTHHNNQVHSKFGHPALYDRLWTPMVHAKAQHIVGDLLRGRLNREDEQEVAGFTDAAIGLESMSQQFPGKNARFVPDTKKKELFEIVPESHLDFGYYRDRKDFAGEHGGDGNLYGRPEDLISERSSTPRSFIGRSGDSPSSSRASSPGPEIPAYRAYSPQRLREMHPAYRDQASHGMNERRQMYRRDENNESASNLLAGAAQPGGVMVGGPEDDVGEVGGHERGQYGLDRWRTGGSGSAGYTGVPVQEEDMQGLDYESYRGRRGRGV